MHRIDTPNATGDNKFTDGDPALGVLATEVDADILNAIQEEIITVIENAEVPLNKEKSDNLFDAILLISGGFTSVLGQGPATADITSLVAQGSPVAGDQFVMQRGDSFYQVDFSLLGDGGSPSEFDAGTKMVFHQDLAPTGWTKETSSSYNNVAIRLTTGNVGTSSGTSFSSVFSSSRSVSIVGATAAGSVTVNGKTPTGSVGNTSLNESQTGPHNHEDGLGIASNQLGAVRFGTATLSPATVKSPDMQDPDGDRRLYTSTEGGGATHEHSLLMNSHIHTASFNGNSHGHTGSVNLDIAYASMIVATKD